LSPRPNQSIRLAGNVAALATGTDYGKLTTTLDTAAAGLVLSHKFYFGRGNKALASSCAESAQRLFIKANSLGIVGGGLSFLTGLSRLNDEFSKFRQGQPVNTTTVVYGFSDIGFGTTYMVTDMYYLKASQRASNAKNAATILQGTTSLPKSLVFARSCFGTLAALPGIALNGKSLFDGATNSHLERSERTEKLISGSLGMTGSLLFLGSALLMSPAMVPVGMTLSIAGTAFTVGQSLYDYRQEIFGMNK
jgi:hypothetical protein